MTTLRCECGNTARTDGFFPCDSDGFEIEPGIESAWEGLYVCGRCEMIHEIPIEVTA